LPSADILSLKVSPLAVRVAVQSFPNGSAAGREGLRPQQLKYLLLGALDDSQLLVAVTDRTNLLLEGKTPSHVRVSNIREIRKYDGNRPIAVDRAWRRLTAKVACSLARVVSTTLLAQRHLGFEISEEMPAAVSAARCYLEYTDRGKLFVKVDFRNAFKTVRRDSIFEAVAKPLHELLPFTTSILSVST